MALKRRTLWNDHEYESETKEALEYVTQQLSRSRDKLSGVKDGVCSFGIVWAITSFILLTLGLCAGAYFTRGRVNNVLWLVACASCASMTIVSFMDIIIRSLRKARYRSLSSRISKTRRDLRSGVEELLNDILKDARRREYDVPIRENGAMRSRINSIGVDVDKFVKNELRGWDNLISIVYLFAVATASVLASAVLYPLAHELMISWDMSGTFLNIVNAISVSCMFFAPIVCMVSAVAIWHTADGKVTPLAGLLLLCIPLVYPLTIVLSPLSPVILPILVIVLNKKSGLAGRLILTTLFAAIYGGLLLFAFSHMNIVIWIIAAVIFACMIALKYIDDFVNNPDNRVISIWKSIFYYIAGFTFLLTFVYAGIDVLIRGTADYASATESATAVMTSYSVTIISLLIFASIATIIGYIIFARYIRRRTEGNITHAALLFTLSGPFLFVLSPIWVSFGFTFLWYYSWCYCLCGCHACAGCDFVNDFMERHFGEGGICLRCS